MDTALSEKVTRLNASAAAATTDVTSSALDMQGFVGAKIYTIFGAITATAVTSVKLQQCDTSDGEYADLEGTSISVAADDDNQVVVHDLVAPTKRYIKVVVDRGTANAVLDGILAVQYGAKKQPTTDDSTTVVGRETHVSPAEGTA